MNKANNIRGTNNLIEANTKLFDENKLLKVEIERLHSIIKEVREKINKSLDIHSIYVDYDYGTELLRQELLEILEKEVN